METVSATPPAPTPTAAGARNSFADLRSEDFLALLIAQLRTQDPLEPISNQELLDQLASVRDIELSTQLTASLGALTGQQRFTGASSLIGQYVTGAPGEDGLAPRGVVVAVRFDRATGPMLQLADGSELPLDRVQTIESPLRAASALIGQGLVGLDRRDPAEPRPVQGIATAVRQDAQGQIVIELDTGDDLRLTDVVSVTETETF